MDKTVILQPRAKEWSWCYHSCLSKSIDKHTSKGLLLLNQVTSTTIETSFSGSEEIRLWSELVIMYKFNSFRCGKNEPFLNKSIKQNLGFSAISVGKESTCNAGDPVRFLGQEDSLGWIGYPSQYSWTYLVAQLVKNLPAMWETWVCSLGWEDPLEGNGYPQPVFWPGEVHELYIPWGHKELVLFSLWLHLLILSGVISPPFSSSILENSFFFFFNFILFLNFT